MHANAQAQCVAHSKKIIFRYEGRISHVGWYARRRDDAATLAHVFIGWRCVELIFMGELPTSVPLEIRNYVGQRRHTAGLGCGSRPEAYSEHALAAASFVQLKAGGRA